MPLTILCAAVATLMAIGIIGIVAMEGDGESAAASAVLLLFYTVCVVVLSVQGAQL